MTAALPGIGVLRLAPAGGSPVAQLHVDPSCQRAAGDVDEVGQYCGGREELSWYCGFTWSGVAGEERKACLMSTVVSRGEAHRDGSFAAACCMKVAVYRGSLRGGGWSYARGGLEEGDGESAGQGVLKIQRFRDSESGLWGLWAPVFSWGRDRQGDRVGKGSRAMLGPALRCLLAVLSSNACL